MVMQLKFEQLMALLSDLGISTNTIEHPPQIIEIPARALVEEQV